MKAVLYALALVAPLLAGCATPPGSQTPTQAIEAEAAPQNPMNERIAYYARVYDVPESLVHRSVLRESRYNPKLHAGPFWGLMQLRLDTARSLGYRGPAGGLLDADTNLRYGVAYLANAYVVAGRNPERALALYASGYYFEARRKGLLDQLRKAQSG